MPFASCFAIASLDRGTDHSEITDRLLSVDCLVTCINATDRQTDVQFCLKYSLQLIQPNFGQR
jgi:hypothetical protein